MQENIKSRNSSATPRNSDRKLHGKREAYKRRNDMYVKAMYGNTLEKEEVRQDSRTALLQQIKDKDMADKSAMTEKTKESDFAISYDRICLQQDKEDRINRRAYLQQFRDENKRLMEVRADQLKKITQAKAYGREKSSSAKPSKLESHTALITYKLQTQ
ncbi:hypothetical protein OS493_016607 [Desmophyllum pertusum]|uniref:Uncharacterized protein n=1 Tax=Desmophyllum pertusum TaxID=174260 RepID=A0A9W9ZD91_9CNID|nr:hypothetical protein OS493_016607 [Desmophyllum pertusum]